MWKPDFNEFLKALKGGKTPRPVLYDFHMSEHIAVPVAGSPKDDSPLAYYERNARALALMGYDYAPVIDTRGRFSCVVLHKRTVPLCSQPAAFSGSRFFDSRQRHVHFLGQTQQVLSAVLDNPGWSVYNSIEQMFVL